LRAKFVDVKNGLNGRLHARNFSNQE
jgi:hypothetical protein